MTNNFSSRSGDAPLTQAEAQSLQNAHRLMTSGNPAAALQSIQQILRLKPGQADALHLKALCHRAAGQADAAIEAFRASIASRPGQPQLLNNLANMLGDMGRHDEAIAAYRHAVAQIPGYLEAWLNLGQTALAAGRAGDAEAALAKARQLDPRSATAWQLTGSLRRAEGRTADAAEAFRRTVELDPNRAAAWLNYGVALRMLGDAEAALRAIDRAAALGLKGAEIMDARASIVGDLGDLEKSLALWRDLVDAFPTYLPGQDALARLSWECGVEGDAAAGFRRAIAAAPNDMALRFGLIKVLSAMSQWEAALEAVEQTSAVATSPMLKAIEANVRDQLGLSTDVVGAFANAVRAAPDDASLHVAFAHQLLRRGDAGWAAEIAGRATEINPLAQDAWAYLGTAWRLLGDAREFWLHDYERDVQGIDLDLPDGFLEELQATVLPLHKTRQQPMEQTLRGGTQTQGFLFGRAEPAIRRLRDAHRAAVEGYLATLPTDPEHPFLMRRQGAIRFTGSWSVRLWGEGYHVNHVHPEGWISSAFYCAVPNAMGEGKAGWIQFGQPPVGLGLDLEPRKVIEPKPGRLALFPSFTWHGTMPFRSEEPRVTCVFDAVPA